MPSLEPHLLIARGSTKGVYHLDNGERGSMCRRGTAFKVLSPQRKALFDLCEYCDRLANGAPSRAEIRPSRAKANAR